MVDSQYCFLPNLSTGVSSVQYVLSMIWMIGSSALSVSLPMAPSWALGCYSVERYKSSAERCGLTGLMGQGQLYEIQQGQVPGPALQSPQPCVALQARGSDWKAAWKKRTWGCWSTETEREPAMPRCQEGQWIRNSVASRAEIFFPLCSAPWVLCFVPLRSRRCWSISREGHQRGWRLQNTSPMQSSSRSCGCWDWK